MANDKRNGVESPKIARAPVPDTPLRRFRRSQGLTQNEMADLLGMSTSRLYRMEHSLQPLPSYMRLALGALMIDPTIIEAFEIGLSDEDRTRIGHRRFLYQRQHLKPARIWPVRFACKLLSWVLRMLRIEYFTGRF